MNNKKLALLIKLALMLITLGGIFICGFIYIFTFSLYSYSVTDQTLASAWMIFLLSVSLPCFVLIFYLYKVANLLQNDNLFSIKAADLLKQAALILFFDGIALLIGTIILGAMNYADYAGIVLYSIFWSIAAIVVSLALFVAYKCTHKAAQLEEDCEGLI